MLLHFFLQMYCTRICPEKEFSICYQTIYLKVLTSNPKRILQGRILRLRRVASATSPKPPQCNPRGAFLFHRNAVSYEIKKTRQMCQDSAIRCNSDTGRTNAGSTTYLSSDSIDFIIFYAFSFAAKSAMASDILICCGQTFSQLLHPMQADGCLSSGTAMSAIGAINPPPVKLCSL